MALDYTATFQIWDVTDGERLGSLVSESKPIIVSPLHSLMEPWTDFMSAKAPKALCKASAREENWPRLETLRVSMTRNGGAGISRVRVEVDGKRYRLDVLAQRVTRSNIMTLIHTAGKFKGLKAPKITFDQEHGDDWITLEYDKKGTAPAKSFTGLHPLTGKTCTATIEDEVPGQSLYRLS